MNHLEGGCHTSMPSYDSFASAAIPPPPLTNQAELAPQGLLLETARMLIIGGNGGDLLRMVANTVQVRIVLSFGRRASPPCPALGLGAGAHSRIIDALLS